MEVISIDAGTKFTTQRICEIIIDTINSNRESPTEINLNHAQNYSMLLFYDIASLRVKCGKKESYIAVPKRYKDYLANYPSLTIKEVKSDDWARIIIKSVDDLKEFSSLFLEIYDAAYWLSPVESFACCSRYEECSDNTKCVQPDSKLARGCIYKKNLINGKIFYNKNQTIN